MLDVVPEQVTVLEATIAPAPSCESTECIIWNFFINNGYSKVQTAGIMGNLKQENRLNIDGDGLAQWNGDRLFSLLQRSEPYSLQTQLDFLLYELNTYESLANQLVKQSTTIETATINFQNQFERCSICMQNNRISYAYDFYNKYSY